MDSDEKLKQAIRAKRESKSIDFKEKFDPTSDCDWCEVVKDIVAIANSEGGFIIIGLRNIWNSDQSGYFRYY